MFRLATPHYRVSGVEELTVERLREWGLRWLLLDVDCTLKRYRHSDPTPVVEAWLAETQAAGVGLCLVSKRHGGGGSGGWPSGLACPVWPRR